MKVLIAFLCIYLATGAESDVELKFKRDAIANYIIKHPNAKISDYGYLMEDLFDSHNLWEQEIIKRESFRRILKNADKKMKDGVINRLHPYAVGYLLYVQRQQRRENLYSAIKSGRDIKITQLISLIQPLIHSFDLNFEHGENYDAFYSQLIAKDDQTTPEEANAIHPYLTFYYIYINDVKIRNNFLLQVDSQSNIPLSSIENLIKSFSERYNLIQKDTSTTTSFNDLVKRKDFKIEDTNLNLLRNYVNVYKTHLKRVNSRNKLISFIEDSPESKMSSISSVMDPFISEYIGTQDINSESDLKARVSELDFTFTEKQVKIIYPHYHEYKIYQNRVAARVDLLSKIGNQEQREDVRTTLKTFSDLFNTIDADVFDSESLKYALKKYDDNFPEENLALIQAILTLHNINHFKLVIRKNIMDYLITNHGQKYNDISPYFESLISAFNLHDINTNSKDNFIAKLNEVEDKITDTSLFDPVYEKYTPYVEDDSKLSTLEALEKLIEIRSKASYDMLKIFIEKFASAYIRSDDEKLNFKDFIKNENLIKIRHAEQLKKIHSRIRLYELYTKRMDIIDFIKSSQNDKSQERSKILVQKLQDLVEIFDIKTDDIKSKEILESRLSRFEKPTTTTKDDNTVIQPPIQITLREEDFKLISNYVSSNQYRLNQRKLLCLEDSKYCGVEKPDGGSELGWFNFFKFFGAEPHEINEKSLDDLNWFKRTFNKIYKYLTGFDYYITAFNPFESQANVNESAETTTTIESTGDTPATGTTTDTVADTTGVTDDAQTDSSSTEDEQESTQTE